MSGDLLIFKHPTSALARMRGMASHRLLAPLRSMLVWIEEEWQAASAEDQPWIYDCLFIARMLLSERERAELERRAA